MAFDFSSILGEFLGDYFGDCFLVIDTNLGLGAFTGACTNIGPLPSGPDIKIESNFGLAVSDSIKVALSPLVDSGETTDSKDADLSLVC